MTTKADHHTPVLSCRWRDAGQKVAASLGVMRTFATLRDQHLQNEIDASELTLVKKLGEGAFATVEQCLYTPKSGARPVMVAVKKLKPEIVSHPEDLASFIAEVRQHQFFLFCSMVKGSRRAVLAPT